MVRVSALCSSRNRRGKKPSAKLQTKMDAAEAEFRQAGDVADDALDDLIAAEMAYRQAGKMYSRHPAICPACAAKAADAKPEQLREAA